MANVITAGQFYDPFFYGNLALAQLNKRLGLAAFVNRQYEGAKSGEKGSTIRVRRPGRFVAQNMPISDAQAQDISPDYMDIVLNSWMGDSFGLTDQEATYTQEQIINDHIGPLAIGLADAIDQSLVALSLESPWINAADGTTPINDFPNIRQILFNNLAPRVGDYSYMLDDVLQNRYEKQAVFYQANTGVDADMLQRDGFLGRKFGYIMFANQNKTAFVGGSATGGGTVTGVNAKGATVLNVATITGTMKRGTSFSIAGFTQKYAVTADAVAGTTLSISPPLALATAGGEAITYVQTAATTVAPAFHRDALALVMTKISTIGDGLGTRMAMVSDPITGLGLRSTVYHTPGIAKTFVRFDALWGAKTLNANLLVRNQI
jgi:hypothetical protein